MRNDTRLGLAVDPIMCRGRGLCAELLPEQILLDEWGYPHLASQEVPPSLRAGARAASAPHSRSGCVASTERTAPPEPPVAGIRHGSSFLPSLHSPDSQPRRVK